MSLFHTALYRNADESGLQVFGFASEDRMHGWWVDIHNVTVFAYVVQEQFNAMDVAGLNISWQDRRSSSLRMLKDWLWLICCFQDLYGLEYLPRDLCKLVLRADVLVAENDGEYIPVNPDAVI